MLATLLCDPVQKRIDHIGGINSFGSYAQIAAELIEPIAQRCRMPKRIKYSIIDIIAEQYQLDRILDQPQTKGKRRKGKSPEQIAERERFPQAKALLEIRAVSGCADPEITAFWNKIAENIKPQPPEHRTDRLTARPKRGRRRPYSRRQKKPAGSAPPM
jgi:hypothetical protein